ncbi:transcription antiterminator LicT [Lachnospiraceae bacterium]|nr:transcription antiterminator LicT [Lachnospiraceae bacterium]
MLITKIYNNNAVESRDKNHREIVVVGCGIAFRKRTGDQIEDSKIQKIFVLSEPDVNVKFKEFLSYIPVDYLTMGNEIISCVQEKLSVEQNTLLYLSLVDHIYGAVQRYKKGIEVKNMMLWDIRRFYREEYETGLYILQIVENYTGVRLSEDEAGFFAFHIAEARMNENSMDMQKIIDIMAELSSIVKYHFQVEFNQESVYYYRFVTHLKFFAQRLVSGKMYGQDDQDELLDAIKRKYVNSYNCVIKIKEFVKNRYSYVLSEDEMLYLTIHIERIIYKSNG